MDGCIAPIQRAADDEIARNLMEKQFKMHALIESQYGILSFAYTQTNDCKASRRGTAHDYDGKGHHQQIQQNYLISPTICVKLKSEYYIYS
jgi:hypothetical protein